MSDIPSSSFTDAAASPCSAASKLWSWESVTWVSGFIVAEELALPEVAPVAISKNVGCLGLGCFVGGGVQPSLVRNGVSCSLSLGVFPVGYRPGKRGVNEMDRCIYWQKQMRSLCEKHGQVIMIFGMTRGVSFCLGSGVAVVVKVARVPTRRRN